MEKEDTLFPRMILAFIALGILSAVLLYKYWVQDQSVTPGFYEFCYLLLGFALGAFISEAHRITHYKDEPVAQTEPEKVAAKPPPEKNTEAKIDALIKKNRGS